jgi:hypothetical protein
MLRRMRTLAARSVLALLVAVPAVATADGFVTLDRQGPTSEAGVEASYVSLSGNNPPTSLRFDVHGQYVGDIGLGGYLTVPVAYLGSTDVTPSITTLGDIEVGGLYVKRMGRIDTVLHVGLALPTQSNGIHNATGLPVPLPDWTATANALTGSRISDLYLSIPHGTSLRFGAAAIYRHDALLARVELGLDVNLSDDAGALGNTTSDTFVRLDAGIGGRFSDILIMGELANDFITGSQRFSGNSSTLDQAALSARFMGGRVHPYLAFVFGLNDGVKNVADVAFTIGFDSLLR